MTKIYCQVCGKHQLLLIEQMPEADPLNNGRIWGDLLCSVCHFVIATLTVDEPGIYELKRVGP